jgi:SAM-dependent methyltransferase
MNYIVCIVENILNYEKYFISNACLKSGEITLVPLRNKGGVTLGKLLNKFLDSLPEDAHWLLFTRDCVEFLEDPLACAKDAPKDALYGTWGARLAINQDGGMFQECLGGILVKESNAAPHYFIHNCPPPPGETFPAETLDSLCLVVSAQRMRQCGLAFDVNLNALYGEDFCLQAFDAHGLPGRIVSLRCCVHGNPFPLAEQLAPDAAHCAKKYAGAALRAGVHAIFGGADGCRCGERIFVYGKPEKDDAKIYARKVLQRDYNLPIVIAAKMLKKGSRVLDCGCAGGDNGVFLAKAIQAELYGMDYNKESLTSARQKDGIYKKLHHIDLNTFSPCEFQGYYHFFDYILLLDVLEHLRFPFTVLQKLCALLKPNGAFIISLPNLAHAYPILNLLQADFTYCDWGILDSTHLRFFTWKSLAVSLAECRFVVEGSAATFIAPDTRGMLTPKSLPQPFYDYLEEDPHFLVCQYVCAVRPSDAPFAELKECNLALLGKAPDRNPHGRKAIEGERRLFRLKVEQTHGRRPPEPMRRHLARLCKEKKYIEAIQASGMFDEAWYRKTYNHLDFFERHPLKDYLTDGWREGRNPCEGFDGEWYLKTYPAAAQSGLCPLIFHLAVGMNIGMACNPSGTVPPEKELAKYARHVLRQEGEHKNTFVALNPVPYAPEPGDTKLLAFYLPQFSPFPENDRWWGRGFTEWTNVTKAVPQFAGHYQPHLPYDVGFYDLRVRQSRLRQEELARNYGIHGFCYHYYWFGGQKIMHGPLENKLRDDEMSLPFCLSWANESWSANWDGSRNNLLIDQPDDVNTELLFKDLLPFFQDDRYIRVDGKPFFMMYRPAFFTLDAASRCIRDLRVMAKKSGLPGLHIALGSTFRKHERRPSLRAYGADAFVEFPPHQFTMQRVHDIEICNPKFNGDIFDLPTLVSLYKSRKTPQELTYRTAFPSWDNTPRKTGTGALIYINTTPETYFDWLKFCIQQTKLQHTPSRNFVFINAWNEWGEGACLEPDRKYGYAFLEMTLNALLCTR